MTADKTTRRGADSTRTDQIGKVFVVVGQDVRKCLVCEQLFTRRASAEHAKALCSSPFLTCDFQTEPSSLPKWLICVG
jgi:hypothetical protein